MEANLDGSSAHAIVRNQAMPLLWVTVDGGHLYWTANSLSGDSVWESGLDGSGAHAIVTGQNLMGGIAGDASRDLYWANSTDFSLGDGAIWQSGLDGSGRTPSSPARTLPTE